MSLQWIGQDDFAVGTLTGLGQDQLPAIGVERALNGFFDDDGDVWRRGAVIREGAAAAPAPLTFMWSGYLGANYRTLVATAAKLYSVAGGVLTDLGQAGLAGPVLPAIVGDKLYLPNGVVWDGVTAATYAWPAVLPAGTRHLGTAFGRLLIAAQNVVAFSASGNAASFAATDYHKFSAGVVVQGIWTARDAVLVFTNFGLYSITNMAFDLTDDFGNPQQTLSRLTPELSLLHESGLAEWAGAVVAPCVDRVFLLDGVSQPVPISDSITGQYMTYVRQGYRPGGAKAFRNHYFMPVLTSAGVPVALWACRLNRPVKARQLFYPWAQWDGYPTGVSALDVDLRTASVPALKAAHKDGWRLDLTASFPPFTDDEPMIDPDGKAVVFDVETRDFPTGTNGQPTHVKRLRLWYYAIGDDGQIKAAYSYGTLAQRYQDVTASGRTYAQVNATFSNYEALKVGQDPADAEWTSGAVDDRYWNVLDPQALPEPGVDPLLWNFAAAERQRYIRARFRSTDGIAQLKLRRIQFAIRPNSHAR